MLRRTLLAGVAAVALAVPAYAADQNATAAATTSTQFIAKQAMDERLANDLIGTEVQGSGGERVGDINDLIIGPNNTVTGAVIGVGGFLGIGEKNVAVSFDRLKTKNVDNNEEVFTLNATKKELQNAPDYLDAEGKPLSLTERLSNEAKELGQEAKEKYNQAKDQASKKYYQAKDQASETYNNAKKRVMGNDKDQSGTNK